MNTNIFDINRFGKYFKYDFKNFISNYGLSLAIISLIPLWGFLIRLLLYFLFSINLYTDSRFPLFSYELSSAIAVIFFGTKVYGKLTERDFCSSWIMIPASKFEKFASMMIIGCIITPAIFITLFGTSDTLMSLFPKYGISAFKNLGTFFGLIDLDFISPFGLAMSEWGNWCINILSFTLGAICFKKNKISKTILILIVIIILLGMGIFAVCGQTSFTSCELMNMLKGLTPENTVAWINILLNTFFTVTIGLLGYAIFLRIKRIQA